MKLLLYLTLLLTFALFGPAQAHSHPKPDPAPNPPPNPDPLTPNAVEAGDKARTAFIHLGNVLSSLGSLLGPLLGAVLQAVGALGPGLAQDPPPDYEHTH